MSVYGEGLYRTRDGASVEGRERTDLLFRFQIQPGSISIVQIHADGAIVRLLNWVPIRTVLS